MSDCITTSGLYFGVNRLSDDVETALEELSDSLGLQQTECKTHSVSLLSNFDLQQCLDATAVYLVSAIAQSIDANLQIRRALFAEQNFNRELLADVVAVVGEEDVDEEFKTMVRNPWMWEGISHMLMHLSRKDEAFHPSGHVLAKTSIKYDVHDHGLDMIAVYQSDALGVSAGECKAYFEDPGRGITDASNKLGEVDSNKRDIEIRAAVNQLRCALPADVNSKLASSFWKEERSYLPFICCDDAHSSDWNRRRQSLSKLAIPVSRKILIPLALADAREAFDNICVIMRTYAAWEG